MGRKTIELGLPIKVSSKKNKNKIKEHGEKKQDVHPNKDKQEKKQKEKEEASKVVNADQANKTMIKTKQFQNEVLKLQFSKNSKFAKNKYKCSKDSKFSKKL